MPHNSLPSTPPAVSAKSAASDVLASLDTQAFLARLLAQQTPFGELVVVSSFGGVEGKLLCGISHLIHCCAKRLSTHPFYRSRKRFRRR